MPVTIARAETVIPILEQRVAETKAEIAAAQERLAHYEATLSMERKRLGPASERRLQARADKRWEVVEEFIMAKGGEGFTAAQLTAAIRNRSLSVGKNFPYQAIDRWLETGKLERRVEDGRYFLVSS